LGEENLLSMFKIFECRMTGSGDVIGIETRERQGDKVKQGGEKGATIHIYIYTHAKQAINTHSILPLSPSSRLVFASIYMDENADKVC
jgi:hypothetical protein